MADETLFLKSGNDLESSHARQIHFQIAHENVLSIGANEVLYRGEPIKDTADIAKGLREFIARVNNNHHADILKVNFLDQLVEAHRTNDHDLVGEILEKLATEGADTCE